MQKIDIAKLNTIREFKISTSTFVDIMDGFKTGSVLSYKLTSFNHRDYYLAAQAYTVQWKIIRKGSSILASSESTWEQVRDFLVPELYDATDLVYVAGSGECIRDAALAGGMSCTYFEKLGFEGVILGGAVRDGQDLNALSVPVIATNLIPTDTQGAYYISETGGSCQIEQTTVHTGDLVVADINGVIIVPYDLIELVLDKALEITNVENEMLNRIQHGERLPDLISQTGRI
ncbi:RraA family protein [Morganella psychrotolerans]|uniref:Putative 4-hydroxy-4-methyl-2-oxoglutarate aldolase n=1 Tax=Morganella psychrotolerans TaxID=368603 RepID=A0A1B8HUQ2_9GAMM|nr:RraA family protein [Morganella psychrotolerans]OBU13479.1 dimethylmenaquinone methyltransferase [Morganella psychrotolerans]